MKIEIARAASRDLEAAFDYIVERNPPAARKIRSAIRRAILNLRQLPQRGRHGQDGTRELVVRGTPYVVVYAVRDDVIFVARIRHTSRDPSP